MKKIKLLLFLPVCFYFFNTIPFNTLTAESSTPSGMVLIPGGEYTSGSNGFNDERPKKNIFLKPFFIDKYEVTQKDFSKIFKKHSSEFRGGSLPVDHVNWYQARDYCNESGKRLPTEAEWEKAARATTSELFYWGAEPDDSFAWHWDNSKYKTHPVGEKKPNKYGLYDMSGNVWEWTADWYQENYYQGRSSSNPKSPFNGKHRVLRGGSFMDKPEGLRVTRRNWDLPGARFKNFGFRCAKNNNTTTKD
jgi:formylglycine-generating enzyme required for sulfatase activity